MNAPLVRVAWYRFRVTFQRRRAGYVAIVLLANLVAALPGRSAGRTPTAQVLRTD